MLTPEPGSKIILKYLTNFQREEGYTLNNIYTVYDVCHEEGNSPSLKLAERLGSHTGYVYPDQYIVIKQNEDSVIQVPEINQSDQIIDRYPKIGSRDDQLTISVKNNQLYFKTGCFSGNLSEFKSAVAKKPADDKHRLDYESVIRSTELKCPEYTKDPLFYIQLSPEFVEQLSNSTDPRYLTYSSDSDTHSFRQISSYPGRFHQTQFTSKEVSFWVNKLDKLEFVIEPVK